ncbi:FadR/GntR family transcriptional regulator [Lichenicola sp.]|uniref:FadR/GntR family transcriptional regulator n=1 Tax=Lichenicola sp. TaxID=2804529 RepID=UPI003B002304
MKQQNRTDQLERILRERIQGGILAVGTKLPSEQAMSAEFQVSRTVVREAVARLRSDGMLETRKGAPTRVRAAAQLAETLSMPQSVEGLLGFLEVRRSIEGEMAALAAARRTEAQCRLIEVALLAIDQSTRDGGSGVQQDLDFHLAIGAATSNAYWQQFVHLFAEPIRSAIGVTRANEARRRDFAAAVADEHRQIYDAIRARDADLARAAVHLHITNAGQRIIHADQAFWQQEGGDLARIFAARALNDPGR